MSGHFGLASLLSHYKHLPSQSPPKDSTYTWKIIPTFSLIRYSKHDFIKQLFHRNKYYDEQPIGGLCGFRVRLCDDDCVWSRYVEVRYLGTRAFRGLEVYISFEIASRKSHIVSEVHGGLTLTIKQILVTQVRPVCRFDCHLSWKLARQLEQSHIHRTVR